jgi:hypothetical protein
MKLYKKLVNGTFVTKTAKSIIIVKDGMKIFNPKEDLILSDGWIEVLDDSLPNNPLDDTVPNIETLKQNLIDDIIKYDSSTRVNIFYINDIPLWLDKATRASLMLRFQAEKNANKEITNIFYGSDYFKIPIDTAIEMLYRLEIYASECYDITQKHIYDVSTLSDPDSVSKYRYESSYPRPLYFSI